MNIAELWKQKRKILIIIVLSLLLLLVIIFSGKGLGKMTSRLLDRFFSTPAERTGTVEESTDPRLKNIRIHEMEPDEEFKTPKPENERQK